MNIPYLADKRVKDIYLKITEGGMWDEKSGVWKKSIGKWYFNASGPFKWRMNNAGWIDIRKPSILKILGEKRFGWREYKLDRDGMLKETGFKDFMTKEEAESAFKALNEEKKMITTNKVVANALAHAVAKNAQFIKASKANVKVGSCVVREDEYLDRKYHTVREIKGDKVRVGYGDEWIKMSDLLVWTNAVAKNDAIFKQKAVAIMPVGGDWYYVNYFGNKMERKGGPFKTAEQARVAAKQDGYIVYGNSVAKNAKFNPGDFVHIKGYNTLYYIEELSADGKYAIITDAYDNTLYEIPTKDFTLYRRAKNTRETSANAAPMSAHEKTEIVSNAEYTDKFGKKITKGTRIGYGFAGRRGVVDELAASGGVHMTDEYGRGEWITEDILKSKICVLNKIRKEEKICNASPMSAHEASLLLSGKRKAVTQYMKVEPNTLYYRALGGIFAVPESDTMRTAIEAIGSRVLPYKVGGVVGNSMSAESGKNRIYKTPAGTFVLIGKSGAPMGEYATKELAEKAAKTMGWGDVPVVNGNAVCSNARFKPGQKLAWSSNWSSHRADEATFVKYDGHYAVIKDKYGNQVSFVEPNELMDYKVWTDYEERERQRWGNAVTMNDEIKVGDTVEVFGTTTRNLNGRKFIVKSVRPFAVTVEDDGEEMSVMRRNVRKATNAVTNAMTIERSAPSGTKVKIRRINDAWGESYTIEKAEGSEVLVDSVKTLRQAFDYAKSKGWGVVSSPNGTMSFNSSVANADKFSSKYAVGHKGYWMTQGRPYEQNGRKIVFTIKEVRDEKDDAIGKKETTYWCTAPGMGGIPVEESKFKPL